MRVFQQGLDCSRAHLYFHSPCFDGIAAAVIAADFLEVRERWRIRSFRAVDYDSKAAWLSTPLPECSAVVDYIYHTGATFWADHHGTTFLTAAAKADFERRLPHLRTLFYRSEYSSCAKLLWEELSTSFDYRNPGYAGLVEWADKIDAARYSSVEEAILGDAPALRIRASLGDGHDPAFFERIIKALRTKTLEEVARSAEVGGAARRVRERIRAGLRQFEKSAWLEDGGIVVFDVDGTGRVISRYAPYYVYPSARYSVGIVRSESGAKITAMRNPWRDFQSVRLGRIFEKFGGGGHERVGAVLLADGRAPDARQVLSRIVDEIRVEDAVNEVSGSTV